LATPVNPLNAGVEVHATFLDNLLSHGFLRETKGYVVLPFALIVSVLAALAILIVNGWVRHMVVFVIALPLPTLIGMVMFKSGVAWPIAWPTLATGAALIGATVFSL